MDENEILKRYNDLIDALKAEKPKDKSEKDRHYAIAITELEKALAYYFTFVTLAQDEEMPEKWKVKLPGRTKHADCLS